MDENAFNFNPEFAFRYSPSANIYVLLASGRRPSRDGVMMIEDLQRIFSSEDGERVFSDVIAALVREGRLQEADAKLMAAIASTGSPLAGFCAAAPAESVRIAIWDDVIEAVETFEGDPITAVGITLWNDLETAVGKQEAYEPGLDLAFIPMPAFRSQPPAGIKF